MRTAFKRNFPLILLACYAFAISFVAVASVPEPIGADYYFHLDIAKQYAVGDFNGGQEIAFKVNLFPYPPLFHLILVPTVWSGSPFLFARILEAIFMPVTYTLTLWLVHRHGGGLTPAVITGLILLGGWTFMDGALQVRPESLDLLLYPISVICLLETKRVGFLASSVATIYGHGIAALSNLYGLAVPKLKDKKWTATLLAAILCVLPILIITALYLPGALSKWGGVSPTENPQEYALLHTPFPFIFGYAGATLLGIPFLFVKNKTELQKLLVWGIAGSIIMLPIWVDRWLHYVSIPLSVLAGTGISRMQGWKRVTLVVMAISCFLLYYLTWMWMSLNGNWWQLGD